MNKVMSWKQYLEENYGDVIKKFEEEERKYVTIRRGKVKIPTGSKQHKYLLVHKLPHSVVTVEDGKKKIKRYYPK